MLATEPPLSCFICGLALSARMKKTPIGVGIGEPLYACRKCHPKVEKYIQEQAGALREPDFTDLIRTARKGRRS